MMVLSKAGIEKLAALPPAAATGVIVDFYTSGQISMKQLVEYSDQIILWRKEHAVDPSPGKEKEKS